MAHHSAVMDHAKVQQSRAGGRIQWGTSSGLSRSTKKVGRTDSSSIPLHSIPFLSCGEARRGIGLVVCAWKWPGQRNSIILQWHKADSYRGRDVRDEVERASLSLRFLTSARPNVPGFQMFTGGGDPCSGRCT